MEANIFIGIMSGTSADGIDIAAAEIDGGFEHPSCRLIAFENFPYEPSVRERIFGLFDPKECTVTELGEMNFLLGRVYGEAALRFMDKHGIDISRVVAIGSHGQTVYHSPDTDIPYTVQIGEGSVISRICAVPCVSDFRVADIAAGGNGAPLVPFTEFVLYSDKEKSVILQNIGGIANSTVLPANGTAEDVFAFDNGPGNMLIDGAMRRLFGKEMDMGGAVAAAGRIDKGLLDYLLQEPYYKKAPPKTTGRELFGDAYIENILNLYKALPAEDIVATLTMLTARVIADSYESFILPRHRCDELVIGGGGGYNPTLVAFIRGCMAKHDVSVFTQEEKGGNSDAKEALAFALLAYYTMAGKPNNLMSATGASFPAVMGKISL